MIVAYYYVILRNGVLHKLFMNQILDLN